VLLNFYMYINFNDRRRSCSWFIWILAETLLHWIF